MPMAIYELAVLGGISAEDRGVLKTSIESMLADFGLTSGAEVVIHDSNSLSYRQKHSAFAATYFGNTAFSDLSAAKQLVCENAPIIPTVRRDQDFSTYIPPIL